MIDFVCKYTQIEYVIILFEAKPLKTNFIRNGVIVKNEIK